MISQIEKEGDGMDLGQRIKMLRENANLTQIELAKTLKINNSTLSQYESGARVPSDDIKIAIANYFGVSLDYLLRGEKKTPAPKSEHQVSDEDIRAAFFGGADDLSEEEMSAMWDDAKDYIQYKLEQRRRKKNGGPD